MNNYENAKIYKIVDNTTDMIYVGSTCRTLQQRLKDHEKIYKRFKAGKTNFVTSFKILVNSKFKIELIKLYPCQNRKELELEEGKIIKQFRNDKLNVVNRNVAGQTSKEYRQNNINLVKEKQHKNLRHLKKVLIHCSIEW